MKLSAIDPKKTAVLVIDMQNDFIEPGAELFSQMGYDFVPKMAAFLDECRKFRPTGTTLARPESSVRR